ncbi:MAG: hypothetical protein MJ162_05240 [Treponema sp.]|nr:hypothetical protein [Treponema sp.]
MKRKIGLTIVFAVGLLFCSCGNKKTDVLSESQLPSVTVQKADHSWYCFNEHDFVKISKPQYAPANVLTPWTEAVRISSANNACDDETGNKAYAIVNRLGVMSFENDKVTLARDVTLFADRTAGDLAFLNNTPIFSVFKSAFFNDTISVPSYKNDGTQHLFLVQFDDAANISYPLVNCNNLIESPNSEVTDYYWDGENWICSIKTITDAQVIFSYIKWYPTAPLLSLSPVNASEKIIVTESSKEAYRGTKALLAYKDAPNRLKNMLKNFDQKIPFIIEVKSAGGSSSRKYENILPDSKEQKLNSMAILSESWSAALFEDGTLFIEGALPGKHILRNGKPVAIRLPRLPAGFVYSDFVISGTTLYAAWEETSFYKTSRSGFLRVDLDETLYKRML